MIKQPFKNDASGVCAWERVPSVATFLHLSVAFPSTHLPLGPLLGPSSSLLGPLKADGAVLTATVSWYAPMLHGLARERRWDEAVRLCRFVKVNEARELTRYAFFSSSQ